MEPARASEKVVMDPKIFCLDLDENRRGRVRKSLSLWESAGIQSCFRPVRSERLWRRLRGLPKSSEDWLRSPDRRRVG